MCSFAVNQQPQSKSYILFYICHDHLHTFVQQTAPLLHDAVADEQHIARRRIGLDLINELLMRIEPAHATPMLRARYHWPELGKVFVRLAARTAIVLRLIDQ